MSIKNIYCRNLILDWAIDQTQLNELRKNPVPLKSQIFPYNHTQLDKNLKEFLSKFDLIMSHAEIFYTPPKTQTFIHIDYKVYGTNRCKLNWIFGAPGSVMEWWKRNDEEAPVPYKTTKIGTRYIQFEYAECTKIYEAEVGMPSLVNSGVPHSVNNLTDQDRWCLSFNLSYSDNTSIQWEDAAEKFKNFLI